MQDMNGMAQAMARNLMSENRTHGVTRSWQVHKGKGIGTCRTAQREKGNPLGSTPPYAIGVSHSTATCFSTDFAPPTSRRVFNISVALSFSPGHAPPSAFELVWTSVTPLRTRGHTLGTHFHGAVFQRLMNHLFTCIPCGFVGIPFGHQ